ncbi:REP-associated tyrosine transposase [Desulfosediminicola flagellatus]|uniref:REP-associated tyrosine transposase n=1 Tax=Desulfosediminicola flagellatus TaxID=2569541 RepID=UPI001E456CD2|nr:transposase [Desulfosediminicola flagellatus]
MGKEKGSSPLLTFILLGVRVITMSRPLRIEYPDAWYHVMNRCRRGEQIFFTDGDREEFLKVLQEAGELWDLRISAYCLMPNHYHLLVHTPKGNLSRCMRHINGVYTQRFNRQHHKEGQLFRGRYKAVLVDKDNYLLEVLRYIHRNPLKAGLVKTLDQFSWSSHKAYLSKAKKWSWLQKEPLLAQITPIVSRQKAAYLDFVSLGESKELERFYSLKNLPSMLGSSSFKEYIKEKFMSLANSVEIPESKALAPDIDKVIACVCEHYSVAQQDLLYSKRGTANTARDNAIYLARRLCCKTLPNVGAAFGIANYSTVSSVIQRVKRRIEKDSTLVKELSIIERKVIKSQKRS